jgi:hypothetical protein
MVQSGQNAGAALNARLAARLAEADVVAVLRHAPVPGVAAPAQPRGPSVGGVH